MRREIPFRVSWACGRDRATTSEWWPWRRWEIRTPQEPRQSCHYHWGRHWWRRFPLFWTSECTPRSKNQAWILCTEIHTFLSLLCDAAASYKSAWSATPRAGCQQPRIIDQEGPLRGPSRDASLPNTPRSFLTPDGSYPQFWNSWENFKR